MMCTANKLMCKKSLFVCCCFPQKRHAAKQLENQAQFLAGRQQLVDALALEQSAIIDILNRKNGSRTDGGEGSADGGVGGGGGNNGGSAVVLSTAEQEAQLDHARSKVANYESQVSSTEQKDQLDAAQAAETAKQLGKARTICIEWQGHNLPPKVSDALTQILAMQALNRGGGSGGGVTESIKRKREADVGVGAAKR